MCKTKSALMLLGAVGMPALVLEQLAPLTSIHSKNTILILSWAYRLKKSRFCPIQGAGGKRPRPPKSRFTSSNGLCSFTVSSEDAP